MSRVFFIGTGCTIDVCPSAPSTDKMLKHFVNDLTNPVSEKAINIVEQFLKDFFSLSGDVYPRLEDVLSFLDNCIESHSSLKGKGRAYFLSIRSAIILLFFWALEQELDFPPHQCDREKINKFVGMLSDGDSVITTNYDLLLDNALLAKSSCNYGVRLRRSLFPVSTLDEVHVGDYESNQLNKGQISLLKLHGSLNWLYCNRCDELDVSINRKLYAEFQGLRCSSTCCTASYDPLIIMPTYYKEYKNRIFKEIWDRAEEAIANAKELYFIGYSLPDADVHVRTMLLSALARSSNLKITIINPCAEAENQYRCFLGDRGQEFRNSTFTKYLEAANAPQ